MNSNIVPCGIHALRMIRPSAVTTRDISAAAATASGAKITREDRHDDVRAGVANGDGGGLTGQERDPRAFARRPAPGHVEEPGGRIHSGHLGPARGGKQRRITGAAAEVDDPLTRPERRAVDDNSCSRQQLLRRALVPPQAPVQAARRGPVLGHVGTVSRRFNTSPLVTNPSGSAKTTHETSPPWPMSTRDAPRATSRSTSAS